MMSCSVIQKYNLYFSSKQIHRVLFGDLQANDSTLYACISVTFLLLQKGADIHVKNKKGSSPLRFCPMLSTLMALYVENAKAL